MTLQQLLFRYRSYTPLPFLLLLLIFAHPSLASILIGFVIALGGECLRAWGVAYAGSETRTTGNVGASKLVTSGPFAYVRNPLYCGNILMYVGIGTMSLALFPYLQIGALLYFIFQYYLIVREEEAFLQRTFGMEYDGYKKHVARFFPRLTAYRGGNKRSADWSAGLRSEIRTVQAFLFIITVIILLYFFR